MEKIITHSIENPFVLLDAAASKKDKEQSFLFTDFSRIITFNSNDDPVRFFEEVQDFLRRGYWLCGYFAYEFGYFLEPALHSLRQTNDFPLVWLGVCKRPKEVTKDRSQVDFLNREASYNIKNVRANITFEEYREKIKKIKYFLEEGLTYQVNYTFKNKFDFQGNVFDFYNNLKRAQPTFYSAIINTGRDYILSLSPELFFRMEVGRIISRPMKGTARRGFNFEQDLENKDWLSGSSKIKAENIMIVDMLRNDLGRISNKVWTPKLFEIEKYRTLYQMTSTIEGKLKKGIRIEELFSSMFPCASVTGAPKVKTMQIIKELEKESRGVYTGAIGYISPQRKACFNVAIRTIHLRGEKAELGIGGGIVYDSKDIGEYKEALLKAKFLVEGIPQFSLIESILWRRRGGYFLLDLHLKRLRSSVEYFSIPIDLGEIKKKLAVLAKDLRKTTKEAKFKVRVLVNTEGAVFIEKQRLEEVTVPVKVGVSSQIIDPENIFLYHKTTQRDSYDAELKKAKGNDFFEVIFKNTKGEVTEGAISNIFIEKRGCLYTPFIKSGLLGGVYREYLLKEKKVTEKLIKSRDIYEADRVYIGNSVRGLLLAEVAEISDFADAVVEKVAII
jgi:para-aminobenzoate synthetase/4-amino-4-deoxychorismate lyase